MTGLAAIFLNTSLAKKNLPSDGTITIWILSERRSAMILLMRRGERLRRSASLFMRSALARGQQLDAARFSVSEQVAALQFSFAVDDLCFGVGLGSLNGG